MWYATTHPTVGIEEGIIREDGILKVPTFIYGESIEIRWNVPDNISISFYDITGREIRSIYNRAGKKAVKLDISNLSSDIYFIVFRNRENTEIKKITIIK